MKLHVSFAIFAVACEGAERKPEKREKEDRLSTDDREANLRKPPRERRKYTDRAETYESQSTCAHRNELLSVQQGSRNVCCDWRLGKSDHHECVGCNPNMGMPCEDQGVFEYEYTFYDYDGNFCEDGDKGCYFYYYDWKDTRDCYCDRRCRDYGDCCDDIADTCENYYRPAEVKQIEFSDGPAKYFIGGSGLTAVEAFARCHEFGGSVMSYPTYEDLERIWYAEGFNSIQSPAFWLPYVSLQPAGSDFVLSEQENHWRPRPAWKWTWYDGNDFFDSDPATVPVKMEKSHLIYENWLSNSTWAEGHGPCSFATTGVADELWIMDKACDKLTTVICRADDDAVVGSIPGETTEPTQRPTTTKAPTTTKRPTTTKAPTTKPPTITPPTTKAPTTKKPKTTKAPTTQPTTSATTHVTDRCDENDLATPPSPAYAVGNWECMEDEERRIRGLKQHCYWTCNGKKQLQTKKQCQLNNNHGWVNADNYQDPECALEDFCAESVLSNDHPVAGGSWDCALTGVKKVCRVKCDDESITVSHSAQCAKKQNTWKAKPRGAIKCEKVCDASTMPAIKGGSWDMSKPITVSGTWSNSFNVICDDDSIVSTYAIRCHSKKNQWLGKPANVKPDSLCIKKCQLGDGLQAYLKKFGSTTATQQQIDELDALTIVEKPKGKNGVKFEMPCRGPNPKNAAKTIPITWECVKSKDTWKFKTSIDSSTCDLTV